MVEGKEKVKEEEEESEDGSRAEKVEWRRGRSKKEEGQNSH